MRLRVKIPTDLQDRNKGPTTEAIAARLKEIQVSSLSGGATPSNGKCTRHTTKQGTCTRRRADTVGPSKISKTPSTSTTSREPSSSSANSLLRRADRPLTPEEVQASIELSSFDLPPLSSAPGNTLSADRLACSGSADGACRVRDRVEGLLQHSAGAKRRSSQHDDEDEDDEDDAEADEFDDEEEMEDEDVLLDQDEDQTDQQQQEDEEEEDDFENEEGEDYEGEEVGEGEGDEDYDLDQDEDDVDKEDEDSLEEVGLERSKAFLQEQKRRAAQKQQQSQKQDEYDEEREEEDESIEAEAEDEVNDEEEEEDGDEWNYFWTTQFLIVHVRDEVIKRQLNNIFGSDSI